MLHSLNGDGRIKASPLAKKLASEKGIDLSQLHGSGDFGRIVKKDVAELYSGCIRTCCQHKNQPLYSAAPAGQVSFDDVPVSQMRKVIAKRLAEANSLHRNFI